MVGGPDRPDCQGGVSNYMVPGTNQITVTDDVDVMRFKRSYIMNTCHMYTLPRWLTHIQHRQADPPSLTHAHSYTHTQHMHTLSRTYTYTHSHTHTITDTDRPALAHTHKFTCRQTHPHTPATHAHTHTQTLTHRHTQAEKHTQKLQIFEQSCIFSHTAHNPQAVLDCRDRPL